VPGEGSGHGPDGPCKGPDAAQPRRPMRPGTSGRWIRLRPRVRGIDGSGLATTDNPQAASERNDFRRRCQSSTVFCHLQRPARTRRGPCSGRHGEGNRALENPILSTACAEAARDYRQWSQQNWQQVVDQRNASQDHRNSEADRACVQGRAS
jgi:hypothetical protein